MGAIAPVIAEQVTAGIEQRPVVIDGGQRARRNLAEHNEFGRGAGIVQCDDKTAKSRQRVGRKRRTTASPNSADPTERGTNTAFDRQPTHG